jgi:hypothetical protein
MVMTELTPTPPKFNITALGAGAAFRECMMFCYHGIKSLGYDTSWLDAELDPDAINIVFGAGASDWQTLSSQASHIIIYNMEQVSPEVPWFSLAYFHVLMNMPVWDYNQRNVDTLITAGIPNIQLVPLGYCPELTEIANPNIQNSTPIEQDIDVLFYGSISPRRKRTLDAIRARGLSVVSSETGQFIGSDRATLISRSKVILNIHYYETVGIFEIVRVSYLLANRKAVVSELSPHTDIDLDIKDAIVSGTLDELPELCWQLVHDHDRRAAIEREGFDIFSRRQAIDILQPAIDQYLATRNAPQPTPAPLTVPKLLNIGAGSRWRYDALNIDQRADFSPDITLNINAPIPYDQSLLSWRFGHVRLARSSFSKIIAKDVFQCCDDLVKTLTHCLELLEDGGIIELIVPHDLSFGAWGLTDTKRTFNEQTWGKILENWWQYGWQTHRFESINQSFVIANTIGFNALNEHNNNWDTVVKIPRAVDALNITLRKRVLTDEEFKQLPARKFLK